MVESKLYEITTSKILVYLLFTLECLCGEFICPGPGYYRSQRVFNRLSKTLFFCSMAEQLAHNGFFTVC